MPAFLLPLAISAISALGGGLGNRGQTSKGNTTSTTTSNPNYNPQDQNFLNLITQKYSSLLQDDPNLSGYRANAFEDINNSTDLKKQNLQEVLAARGIKGPAAGVLESNIDNSGFAQKTQVDNSLPLLIRQLTEGTLGQAGGFFASTPHGSTQTTTGNATQTGPGNVAGGALGNLAPVLAYLFGKGAFKSGAATAA